MGRVSTYVGLLVYFGCLNSTIADYEEFKTVGMKYEFHKKALRWNDARNVCKSQGGALAMPRNVDEAKILLEIFARYPASSLDCRCNKDRIMLGFHGLFTEGKHHMEKEYFTVSGAPIDEFYHTWAEGYRPIRLYETNSCGSMWRTGGLSDMDCKYEDFFICEKVLSSRPEIIADGMCTTKGYTYADSTDQCYKVYRVLKSWLQARGICYAEGAHLAIIDDEVEHKYLSKLVNDNSVAVTIFHNIVLMGYHALYDKSDPHIEYKNRQFITVLDQNLNSTAYSPREMRFYADYDKNCSAMYWDGWLDTFECDQPAMFICEQPKRQDFFIKKFLHNILTQSNP